MAVLTPTTLPPRSSSGPPELPGLIAASVWTMSGMEYDCPLAVAPPSASSRPRPETMPVLIEQASPNGLPMATTPWPTFSASEEPSASGCSSPASTVTLITARSAAGAVPTTVAAASTPSANVTVILVAPSTTWLLVTMWPCASYTNPEPCATPKPEPGAWGVGDSGSWLSLCALAPLTTTVMLTTDGLVRVYRSS